MNCCFIKMHCTSRENMIQNIIRGITWLSLYAGSSFYWKRKRTGRSSTWICRHNTRRIIIVFKDRRLVYSAHTQNLFIIVLCLTATQQDFIKRSLSLSQLFLWLFMFFFSIANLTMSDVRKQLLNALHRLLAITYITYLNLQLNSIYDFREIRKP